MVKKSGKEKKKKESHSADKASRKSSDCNLNDLVANLVINDDNWRCIVTMLVETSEAQDNCATTMLEEAFDNGYRKSVRLISHKKMLSTLRATPKPPEPSYAAEPTPSLQQLRDCARATLTSSSPIATLTTAELIKWMIYEARLESLARSAAEVEAAGQPDREFLAMQQETATGPPRKGEPVKRPESARRTTSRLRRRGEEWRDEVCVDDAPINGPSLYILLAGFREPGLPSELIKLGVPLNCIFSLENLRTGEEEEAVDEEEPTTGFEVAGDSMSIISKSNAHDEFWASVNDDSCKEVAVRPFCPAWNDDSNLNDVYNCVSYAMYDVNDLLLSHADYLGSMKIVNVYEPRPESQSTDVYEKFLSVVPEECATVPVVLEAVLRQVEENIKDQPSNPHSTDASPVAHSATSLTNATSAAAFARLDEKLRLLNLKYDLVPTPSRRPNGSWRYGCAATTSRSVAVELILHGDMERLNACRAGVEANDWKLASAGVEENWIAGLWKEGDEVEVANCKKHIPGVLECCATEGIDRSLANHLLNLLAFQKMLEESNNTSDDSMKTSPTKPSQKSNESSPLSSSAPHPEKINRTVSCPQERGRNKSGDINLSGNNCEAQSAVPRIAQSTENFVREIDKVCRMRRRNIIFDESRESEEGARGEPYFKENENSAASLNANPKQMRITEEFVGQRRGEDARSCGAAEIPDTSSCPCLHQPTTSTPQPFRAKSLTASRLLSPLPSRTSSRPRSTSDDAQQRKRRCLQDFERCVDLFGLIDARESCGLAATARTTPLEEFEEAEVLGADAFRQIVRLCAAMDGWTCERRRFVTTDSILLLFRDELAKTGTLLERRFTFAPRTALCLRDFAEYIVDEEREWLEQRRKSREDAEGVAARRWSKNGPIFRDEDFVLPGSLKACEMRLQREERERVRLEELERVKMEEEKRKGEEKEKGKAKKKGKEKDKGEQENANPGKKPSKKLQRTPSTPPPAAIVETPSSPSRSFDFIGYDLGERRAQVSNLTRAFRARDGTRVRVERVAGDKKRRTSVGIEVEKEAEDDVGCSLWYHEEEETEAGVFHLTMDNGVIVAFERIRGCEMAARRSLPFEIQMSWPSGLIIRPASSADWPFYILQCYESDELESHRKYMSNGDVVKFFRDGRVVVLRACGRVITIVNSDGGDGDSEMSCESDGCVMGEEEDGEMSRESLDMMQELGCPEPIRSTSSGLRYVVLEPDGRQYEVRGGTVVRELDRLRASLAEEYMPEEKFLRRADGTDALFTSNGELVVSFPDGTRTLSSPYTETTPATCDWSPDDLNRYFPDDQPDDGFVSILPRGRAEHARYATVAHEPDSSMRVTMGKLCVRLVPRGYGAVEVGDRICIELNDDTVVLTRRACPSCPHFSSRATFHLLTPPCPSDTLLSFDDSSSHLTIRHDGTISRKSRGSPATCTCIHDVNEKPRLRLIAARRDGTAHEYHDRSELEDMLDAMGEEEEASLVCDEIEGRCGMEWRMGLRPMPRIMGTSRTWRMDYKIRDAKPTMSRRRDDDDDEADEPLLMAAAVKKTVLTARVFEGIGRYRENALAVVQEALVRYWQEIATGTRSTEDDVPAKCECLDEAEERMRDVALGRARTIEPEIYEAGRQHLRRLKVQRDEARVRRMIDRAYRRSRDGKCPR